MVPAFPFKKGKPSQMSEGLPGKLTNEIKTLVFLRFSGWDWCANAIVRGGIDTIFHLDSYRNNLWRVGEAAPLEDQETSFYKLVLGLVRILCCDNDFTIRIFVNDPLVPRRGVYRSFIKCRLLDHEWNKPLYDFSKIVISLPFSTIELIPNKHNYFHYQNLLGQLSTYNVISFLVIGCL